MFEEEREKEERQRGDGGTEKRKGNEIRERRRRGARGFKGKRREVRGAAVGLKVRGKELIQGRFGSEREQRSGKGE